MYKLRDRGSIKTLKTWDITNTDSDSSDDDWEPGYSSEQEWEDIDITICERGHPEGIRIIYDPESDDNIDMSGLSSGDVDIIIERTKISKSEAVSALKRANGDLLTAIMDITKAVNQPQIMISMPSLNIKSFEDDNSEKSMTKEKLSLLNKLPDEVEYSEEEFDYLAGLPKERQKSILTQEREIISAKKHKDPLRFRILEGIFPLRIKATIIDRIDHFNKLEPGDSEYSKMSSWINGVSRIPFGRYIQSSLNANDDPARVCEFIGGIRKGLDEVVYGHNSAKERIIELIGANIRNPTGRGYCIGIQGPAGNGKTTLIKHGIAPRLGRPFTMISLGGATDSDFLAGHGYTYEGSRPGRMSEALVEAGCMNPIIFFDELDKVSQTAKGEEIYGYLCHLIDFTQNDQIHDKYFAGVDLDFSRAIFVFSFNDEKTINPILRDRIHIIRTDGFGESDKVRIARDYLLPALLKDFNLPRDSIEIDDAIYRELINHYTNGEDGVRSLQRSIHSLISRVNINLLLGKLKTPVNINMEMMRDYMVNYLADLKRERVPDMYI